MTKVKVGPGDEAPGDDGAGDFPTLGKALSHKIMYIDISIIILLVGNI